MRRPALSLVAAALVTASAATLAAQKMTEIGSGRRSPHVKAEWTVDGANVSITYGRPALKGRAEAQMMPPGQVWRTGADEATILTTDKALKFGTVSLQPGSYTINTQPDAGQWQLILGKLGDKGEKQWGIPYQQPLEIGRTPMKVGKTASPVEQLTISIDDTASGAALRIEWGTVSATTTFTVG